MVWCEFLFCAGLLAFSAYHLCMEGVTISERTHISAGVIGMFFLAVATSFPEIVTASTAVYSLGRIGLGYGDIIGSVLVNFMILMGLDYYYGKGGILAKVSRSNRITGLFVLAVVLIVTGAAALRFSQIISLPRIGMLGAESILIVAAYFIYLRVMNRMHHDATAGISSAKGAFWKTWAKFLIFLVIVMLLGMWMARIGEKIVLVTGLSQTFTGTLLLGAATSLPEIVVSFAALKASSVDMAVGNILGSNMFDVCIIPLLDVLSESPILGMLTAGQILATVFALALAVIVAAGLFIKKKAGPRVGWDTGLVFAVGLAGFVLLYFIK